MRQNLVLTSLLALVVCAAPAAASGTKVKSRPLPSGATDARSAVQNPENGDVFVADWATDRVWRLSDTVFAGNGLTTGPLGDGGDPASASFDSPTALAFRPDGGLVVADTDHHLIRLVKNGVISTIAGSGADSFGGDGGPATDADLLHPAGVAVLPDGKSLLVADSANHRIRRVDGVTGVIETIAGDGTDAEVDGPRLTASFSFPTAIAVESDGTGALVVDRVGGTVRRVDLRDGGHVTTVAGPASGATTPADPWTYSPPLGSFNHDNDPLTAGFSPAGIVALADGSFVVFDAGNDRVRRVEDGDVETLVGSGVRGDQNDDLEPTATDLDSPVDGFVDKDGDLVVLDAGNRKLRTVKGLALPSATKDPKATIEPPSPTPAPPVLDKPLPPAEPLLPVPLAPVPAPVMGQSVGVTPGSGVVRFRRAGGKSFSLLTEGSSLPVGSILDAREGSVTLSSAAGGKVQSARFSDGMFEVRQKRGSVVTDLHLRGTLAGCPKAWAKPTARAAGKKRPTRRLWGDGKGKFRTHGSSAVATVRGTKWLTEDRCYGTLVKVQRGVVDVKPVRGGKTVKVRAGQQRLVRHRRAGR